MVSSRHDALAGWETTSWINRHQPPHAFGWAVSDPDNPSATWWFRTPALLAISALSVQALSGGRLVLGIGTSGPQVMEGWHGVRFDRPILRTRETIEIIRRGHRRWASRL